MFSTLFYTSLVVLAPALRAAAFSVNSPDVTSCGDVHISWEAKQAPYSIWIIKPESPCDDPIVDLGEDHMGTTMTWNTAGVPAGMKVQISMQDATGEEAWSDVITVKGGSDSSCVPKELAALVPASSSAPSSSAASSAAPSSVKGGSTLVVTPTMSVTNSQPSGPVQAAGAAAGIGSSPNSAVSISNVGSPVVLFGALVGVIMLAL